jgi:hypothetical protein
VLSIIGGIASGNHCTCAKPLHHRGGVQISNPNQPSDGSIIHYGGRQIAQRLGCALVVTRKEVGDGIITLRDSGSGVAAGVVSHKTPQVGGVSTHLHLLEVSRKHVSRCFLEHEMRSDDGNATMTRYRDGTTAARYENHM